MLEILCFGRNVLRIQNFSCHSVVVFFSEKNCRDIVIGYFDRAVKMRVWYFDMPDRKVVVEISSTFCNKYSDNIPFWRPAWTFWNIVPVSGRNKTIPCYLKLLFCGEKWVVFFRRKARLMWQWNYGASIIAPLVDWGLEYFPQHGLRFFLANYVWVEKYWSLAHVAYCLAGFEWTVLDMLLWTQYIWDACLEVPDRMAKSRSRCVAYEVFGNYISVFSPCMMVCRFMDL